MNILRKIKTTLKTGKEQLTVNKQDTNYNLLDFWRWSVSDILDNATRGRFAEFIVGSDIDFDSKQVREEWDYDIDKRSNISKRHSDIYVFCHLKHKDQETIDPLKMEQWDFYVVATKEINDKLGKQGTLSLGTLKKTTSPIEYKQIKIEIQRIYNKWLST
jgi:hypothetical protein